MRWSLIVLSQISSPTASLGDPYSSTQRGGFPAGPTTVTCAMTTRNSTSNRPSCQLQTSFPPELPSWQMASVNGVTPNSGTPG